MLWWGFRSGDGSVVIVKETGLVILDNQLLYTLPLKDWFLLLALLHDNLTFLRLKRWKRQALLPHMIIGSVYTKVIGYY